MTAAVVTAYQEKIIVIVGLILLTLVAYWQVQYFEFINYDDNLYVTENFKTQSGITQAGIVDAFTDLRTSNWHPLTMLSHMLDWALFGQNAGGHHWSSLIIHIINTVLLFLLLNQMTGAIWRSALVAALFAIHPINVESVAWVAERKNVLSTFFWFLTMLFYVWYANQPQWKRYLPVLLCFALGLMSKPMLVTLPFVLLLMDYWPLKRIAALQHGEIQRIKIASSLEKKKISFLIFEKVPLLILSAISICLTLYAAKSGSTIAYFDIIPLQNRIGNAIVSYGQYIKKMFWPMDLAVFYPYRDIQIQQTLLTAAILIIITAIALRYYKKFPFLLVGWFWYLGTLVPVIGIVQVGSQAMADRYAYVPFIGLFVLMSWSLGEITKNHLLRNITSMFVIIILTSLLITTCNQLNYWKNSFVLFSRALNTTEGSFIAHIGMGIEFTKQKRIDEAIEQFNTAININPKNPANYIAFVSLGHALSLQDKKTEAIEAFRQALRINNKFDEAYHKLGFVLFQAGRVEEAIQNYQKAIAIYNDYPLYHSSLGNAYISQGKVKEAEKEYNEVLRLQPNNAGAHNNLAMVLMQQNRIDEAMKHFQEALRLQPMFANAHYRLSIILKQKGLNEKADYHYNEAIRINPAFKKLQR